MAVLSLCCSPATVFLTYPYTESWFLLATFGGALLLEEFKAPVTASLLFTASCLIRSNGVINAGFLLHYAAKAVSAAAHGVRPLGPCAADCIYCACGIACMMAGLRAVFAPGIQTFCQSLAWQDATPARPYCDPSGPTIYGHVQSEYWNVGLFRFYQLKQLPNFLVAAPTAAIACSAVWAFVARHPLSALTLGNVLPMSWFVKNSSRSTLSTNTRWKSSRTSTSSQAFVYTGQLACMVILGVAFIHIQVLTRFLTSCPALYWHVAETLQRGNRQALLVSAYCLLWAWAGLVLFPNFYPWT